MLSAPPSFELVHQLALAALLVPPALLADRPRARPWLAGVALALTALAAGAGLVAVLEERAWLDAARLPRGPEDVEPTLLRLEPGETRARLAEVVAAIETSIRERSGTVVDESGRAFPFVVFAGPGVAAAPLPKTLAEARALATCVVLPPEDEPGPDAWVALPRGALEGSFPLDDDPGLSATWRTVLDSGGRPYALAFRRARRSQIPAITRRLLEVFVSVCEPSRRAEVPWSVMGSCTTVVSR